jgi:hypothetical protein
LPYRHTQPGWAVIAGSIVGFALAAAVTLSLSKATLAAVPWLVIALFALVALGLVTYASLTVTVDDERIQARFGIGLVRKTIDLADIVRCDIVRTPTWWGWGLHWTPSGWLYNVSGRAAVKLAMASQRAVMIGSDEADRLKEAIDVRLEARAKPQMVEVEQAGQATA